MISITFKDYKNINYGFNHFFGKEEMQETLLKGLNMCVTMKKRGPRLTDRLAIIEELSGPRQTIVSF